MPAAADRSAGGNERVRPQWPLLGLLTMSAAVFLSVTTELLPTGLLPSMSRDLGVTEGRLGLIVTGFALMVALFATPIGLALAWVPRRRLLVAALIGYTACNLITATSHWYFLVRFWVLIMAPLKIGVPAVSSRRSGGADFAQRGKHRASRVTCALPICITGL